MSKGISRRQLLQGVALTAALGVETRGVSSLASVALGPRKEESAPDTLVVLFLRGGADGLNIIVPYGDDDYYKLRPNLALSPPSSGAARSSKALKLDSFFGLHPAMSSLLPIYQDGNLLPVHAVGSFDHTLSHFQAMAAMERGLANDGPGAASGWLARHLNSTEVPGQSPLRSVALSETLPASLRGATQATSLTSLANYEVHLPTGTGGLQFHADERRQAMEQTLAQLYSGPQTGDLADAGKGTLAALDAVRRLDPSHYHPTPGVHYPKTGLSHALQQVACMVKGAIGLEVACIDVEGWDTHVDQGRDTGWQPARLTDLATSLAAFYRDMGNQMHNVTVVTMTEFGRRAYENTGLGTDHGRASVMLVMGGAVKGGRVLANWPGLNPHQLVGPGDLHVTTDYRDILGELVAKRLHNSRLDLVFPNHTPHFHGIV